MGAVTQQDSAQRIVCFVGPSGSGKTTLIEKLIPALQAKGVRVGVIKNDAHTFQIDREGKDSDRFFRAGAAGVLIQSPTELAFRRAHADRQDPGALAAHFFPECDLVLVEGASWSDHPKIEVWHSAIHPERIEPTPAPLLGVVTDGPREPEGTDVPVFHWEDIAGITLFLC